MKFKAVQPVVVLVQLKARTNEQRYTVPCQVATTPGENLLGCNPRHPNACPHGKCACRQLRIRKSEAFSTEFSSNTQEGGFFWFPWFSLTPSPNRAVPPKKTRAQGRAPRTRSEPLRGSRPPRTRCRCRSRRPAASPRSARCWRSSARRSLRPVLGGDGQGGAGGPGIWGKRFWFLSLGLWCFYFV